MPSCIRNHPGRLCWLTACSPEQGRVDLRCCTCAAIVEGRDALAEDARQDRSQRPNHPLSTPQTKTPPIDMIGWYRHPLTRSSDSFDGASGAIFLTSSSVRQSPSIFHLSLCTRISCFVCRGSLFACTCAWLLCMQEA